MLDKNARTIIMTAARGAGLSPETIASMLELAEGKTSSGHIRPVLMTQSEKSRQLAVSRFTVRKLVRAGKLHPLILLPGLVRYRADELIGD